ncbi:MAG TPA: DASS family sodium-coupled anion symporter [Planctomycetota bacterium]|nr:DASS family sodium-coupled anion symporter [Planctomycetota bacterium]
MDDRAAAESKRRPRRLSWRARRKAEAVAGGWLSALEVAQPKRVLVFLACLAGALALTLVPEPTAELDAPQRRALFIAAFAALLWISDAVPAFAVGMLVIALQVGLLGSERGGASDSSEWEGFAAVLGHPLIWLFFGGLVLAEGLARAGLDRRLAMAVLERTGDRPAAVLGGTMALCFVLSTVMSNTATTAMVLATFAPLLARLDDDEPFVRALILGVAGAANVGGMASLIGTAPNAIAAGALAHLDGAPRVDFLRWLGLGLPVAAVLVVLLWRLLLRVQPPRVERLPMGDLLERDAGAPRTPFWMRLVVGGTAALTVGLWTTTQWHGIPTAAVAFVPIAVLTTSGVIGASELRRLPWDVLFLLAGGLALGGLIVDTDLDRWLVGLLPLGELNRVVVALALGYLTVLVSNLMSNTAATNLLIPIAFGLSAGREGPIAITIALSASAAMLLPIATPPNALAFGTGRLPVRAFLAPGLMLALLAPPLALAWASLWL